MEDQAECFWAKRDAPVQPRLLSVEGLSRGWTIGWRRVAAANHVPWAMSWWLA